MTEPNGAEEEPKGGEKGKPEEEGGAGNKPEGKEASSKTYTQDEVDQLLKDKENAIKGAEGWEIKKLQKELDELKKSKEEAESKARETEFNKIAETYGVDPDKVREEGIYDPEVLEKAFKIAGKTPKATMRLDSGRNIGGKDTSGMSPDDKLKEGFRASKK